MGGQGGPARVLSITSEACCGDSSGGLPSDCGERASRVRVFGPALLEADEKVSVPLTRNLIWVWVTLQNISR